MKLNTKLIIIMLSLLVLAMLTLFTLNQYAQNDLVSEIQESSQEISKAVQMSIEDLTSETETSRLNEYLTKAREKGINEINIINSEGEIIDSSDPDKIGKKREIKKLEKGVHAAPQPAENPRSSPRDLMRCSCRSSSATSTWAMSRSTCCWTTSAISSTPTSSAGCLPPAWSLRSASP